MLSNKELQLEDVGFYIYPNPTSEQVTFSITANETQQTQLFFYAIDGKQCASFDIMLSNGKNEFAQNIRNLEKGIYFVKILVDNKYITKKLIVN